MDNFKMDDLRQTEWYQQLPDVVKEAIERMPPNMLYRFKDSKKECHIVAYDETNAPTEKITLRVQKTGNGGLMAEMGMGHLDTNQVFGVDPDDLELATNEEDV